MHVTASLTRSFPWSNIMLILSLLLSILRAVFFFAQHRRFFRSDYPIGAKFLHSFALSNDVNATQLAHLSPIARTRWKKRAAQCKARSEIQHAPAASDWLWLNYFGDKTVITGMKIAIFGCRVWASEEIRRESEREKHFRLEALVFLLRLSFFLFFRWNLSTSKD